MQNSNYVAVPSNNNVMMYPQDIPDLDPNSTLQLEFFDEIIKDTVINNINNYSIEGQHSYSIKGQHITVDDINAINIIDMNNHHHDNYNNDYVPVTDGIVNNNNDVGDNNCTSNVDDNTSSFTMTNGEYSVFKLVNVDFIPANHSNIGIAIVLILITKIMLRILILMLILMIIQMQMLLVPLRNTTMKSLMMTFLPTMLRD